MKPSDLGEANAPSAKLLFPEVVALVRGNPSLFIGAGRLLDEEFSRKAVTRALEASRPPIARSRTKTRAVDLTRRARLSRALREVRQWLEDPTQVVGQPPSWNHLASMSLDEAAAVLVLTWIMYDSDCSTFKPVLCEFQEVLDDPWTEAEGYRWQGKQVIPESLWTDDDWRAIVHAALSKVRACQIGPKPIENTSSQTSVPSVLRDGDRAILDRLYKKGAIPGTPTRVQLKQLETPLRESKPQGYKSVGSWLDAAIRRLRKQKLVNGKAGNDGGYQLTKLGTEHRTGEGNAGR